MNKFVKILLSLLLLLSLVVGGAIFYASSQIDSGKVRTLTIQELQKAFPNANIELDKVNYNIGLSVKLNFESLSIDLKTKDSNLLKVDKFQAKIPLLALLLGDRKALVELTAPSINFEKIGKSNNFEMALDSGKKAVAAKKKEKSESKSKGSEPSRDATVLLPFSFDLLVKNAKLTYIDKTKSEIIVEEIKIKDFGSTNKTGFEFKSMINLDKVAKAKVLIIGEADFVKLLSNKDLPINLDSKISEIYLHDLGSLPNLNAQITILARKSGQVTMAVNSKIGEQSSFDMNLKAEKERIDIDKFKLNFNLKELTGKLTKIQKSLKDLDLREASLTTEGSILINKGKLYPNLSGAVLPYIGYKASGIDIKNSLDFSLTKGNLALKAISRLLDGKIESNINGKIDINNFDPKNLRPFDINILVDSLIIKNDLVTSKENKVEASRKKIEEKKQEINEVKKETPLLIPPHDLKMTFKDVVLVKDKLNGEILSSARRDSINLKKVSLVLGKGTLKANSKIRLSKIINGNFNVDMKEIELSSFSPFAPKGTIKDLTGSITASTKGKFSSSKDKLTYSTTFNVSGEKIGVKGVNFGKILSDYLKSIPQSEKYLKKLNLDAAEKLAILKAKGTATQSLATLNSFYTELDKKKLITSGKGSISLDNKKSEVKMDIWDNGSIKKAMKKNFNREKIPLLLKGNGFNLKPDTGYTTGVLAKSALKTQGKKNLDKLIDKNLKGKDAEKVKKIFKGLFK